jgi:hypothetical protein|nr:hypothetical protein Q903MT_gene3138 [Picea sitchensis]
MGNQSMDGENVIDLLWGMESMAKRMVSRACGTSMTLNGVGGMTLPFT